MLQKYQEIIQATDKRNWLMACKRKKLDPWGLLDLVNETVYTNEGKPVIAKFRECRNCGTRFGVKSVSNIYYIRQMCSCGKDGTNLMTLAKLETKMLPDEAAAFYQNVGLEKRKGLPNTIECWTAKGCTITEAAEKVNNVQSSRAKKAAKVLTGSSAHTIRSKHYWIAQGYTEVDAVAQVKQVQVTNGLAFYVARYGEIVGTEKFDARIARWLNAPGNKNMIRGRSKSALSLFKSLGVGYYGEHEKVIRGEMRSHRVDFCYENKIIEFYGDYWHGNPKIYNSDNQIRKKRVGDIWAHDAKKVADLATKGFDIMIVWESDFVNDSTLTTIKCKEFINAS